MKIYNNPEITIAMTSSWKGERFDDGRPRVPDSLLERLRNITLEEAWAPMFKIHGYRYQFEGRFMKVRNDCRLIGRALTATFVPSRPDVHMAMLEYGHKVQGFFGYFNQWVIDDMQSYDVLVLDGFDKIRQGTTLGGNLATSIRARTAPGGGAVIWGGIRDIEQIQGIDEFQVYYRGMDPSSIDNCMMSGYNVPCRVGDAICMPGDVVLGTDGGVIFIPPHLAEEVAEAGEKTQIKDIFGFERLASKVYDGSQIDAQVWSREVMDDFQEWLKTAPQAAAYQHLDWTKDIEESNNTVPGSFTGLS